MWILIFLFFLSVIALGWALFGVYIWLFFLEILRKDPPSVSRELRSYPLVSLIIPTYNEADFILRKMENINALDYPKDRLQILYVDGGSEDATKELMKLSCSPHTEILNSPCRGKVNQLNFALSHCRGDFIFVTDADSLLSSNAIQEVMKEFESDNDIYLTGIYSYPESSYLIDRYYWLMQNKGRLLESRAFSSSIVIAVCYAFRAGLINELPEDVIADDVYLGYITNNAGHKVSYIDRCNARELRAPKNVKNFLSHKFRKSNAFLRESLRFLYKTSDMNTCWKFLFLTRLSQLLILPWLFFFYVILAGSLLSLQRYDVVIIGTVILILLCVITSKVFSFITTPEDKFRYSLATITKTFLLSNLILLACGISFTFFRHDSCYKRTDAS